MRLFDHIIQLSWLAFIVFWFLAWGWSKPTAEHQSAASRRAYLVLLFIGFTFLWNSGSLASVYPLGIHGYPYSRTVHSVANILAVLSVVLAIWARATLGSNWSANVQIKKDHRLVTRGPYRFVRHPIYTAMLGLFLATALAQGTLGGFVGFPFVFISCLVKARQEEGFMTRQFPNEYPAYRNRTWQLVPFIW